MKPTFKPSPKGEGPRSGGEGWMTPRQIFFNTMPGSRPAKVRLPPQVETWQSNPSRGVPTNAFGVGVLRNTGENKGFRHRELSCEAICPPALEFLSAGFHSRHRERSAAICFFQSEKQTADCHVASLIAKTGPSVIASRFT